MLRHTVNASPTAGDRQSGELVSQFPVPPTFAAKPSYCEPYRIGERNPLHDPPAAISAAIAGQLAEPIDRLDPAWGNHYTIARAVAEAMEYGYANDAAQMADTIRAAARAGRIRGAAQDPADRWTVPATTFRAWLVRSQGETRGRPKQAE